MSDTYALCPVTFDAAAVEVIMSFYVVLVCVHIVTMQLSRADGWLC